MRTLPIVAECLLQAFDIPRRNEAFVGDLVEEYGQGRYGEWRPFLSFLDDALPEAVG